MGTALDSLPAGVRVFGVPDPVLPFEHVEHVLWRAYRTVWPNKRLDPNDRAREQSERSRARTRSARSRSSATRSRSPIRTPREVLRTYWAWVELTHGERWARRAARLAQADRRARCARGRDHLRTAAHESRSGPAGVARQRGCRS